METSNKNNLLHRINDLEKTLEALEQKSGLLSEEIRNVRENIEVLKSENGAGINSDIIKGSQMTDTDAPTPVNAPQSRRSQPAPAETRMHKTKTRKHGSLSKEQFIGKNAMGIGASVLVFIAVIMFATLLMPYMGQELKCAAMYFFSFLLIGLGEWIYRKQKNGYLILSACGAGVLYISIVATHVYFRFIDMVPLYALLLLWMAYASYLGRKRSLVFVIIGQIGIVMSIVMSAYGIDTSLFLYLRFAFLLISEALYFTVFLRSDYKYNLANTVGLMCAFTVFDGIVHNKYLDYYYAVNKPGVIVVLLTIVIMTAAAARLILISKNEKNIITSSAVSVLSGFGVALVCNYLSSSMHNLGFLINIPDAPILMDSAWCYLPTTFYYAVNLMTLMRKKVKESSRLSLARYILFTAFLLSILMLPRPVEPVLTTLILLVMVVYNFRADRRELYMLSQAVVLIGLTVTGYARSIYAPIFMLLLSAAQMIYSRTENPFRKFKAYEIISYLTTIAFVSVLVPMVLSKANIEYRLAGFFFQTALIIGIQLAAKKWNWMEADEDKLGIFHIANLALMGFSVIGIWNSEHIWETICSTLMVCALFSINLKSLVRINEKFGAYIAAKYSVLIGLFLHQLKVPNYAYSIAFLIMAVSCIIVGFRIPNKSARLYGLVLSMVSIVKLLLLDISYSNTLMRAVSFLVSGLLCFAISLIYNHINKQQKTVKNQDAALMGAENTASPKVMTQSAGRVTADSEEGRENFE